MEFKMRFLIMFQKFDILMSFDIKKLNNILKYFFNEIKDYLLIFLLYI